MWPLLFALVPQHYPQSLLVVHQSPPRPDFLSESARNTTLLTQPGNFDLKIVSSRGVEDPLSFSLADSACLVILYIKTDRDFSIELSRKVERRRISIIRLTYIFFLYRRYIKNYETDTSIMMQIEISLDKYKWLQYLFGEIEIWLLCSKGVY